MGQFFNKVRRFTTKAEVSAIGRFDEQKLVALAKFIAINLGPKLSNFLPPDLQIF